MDSVIMIDEYVSGVSQSHASVHFTGLICILVAVADFSENFNETIRLMFGLNMIEFKGRIFAIQNTCDHQHV